MFRKELWPGPYTGPEVVPRMMRGDTLVIMSYIGREIIFPVTKKSNNEFSEPLMPTKA